MASNIRQAGEGEASDSDRLMALLAYIIGFIVPLIILLTEGKNRPFQRYHAVQALALDIAWLVIFILLNIFISIVSAVTFGLGLVLACLFPIAGLVAVVLFIYYAVLAYQGKYFDVPVVTAFCRERGWLQAGGA